MVLQSLGVSVSGLLAFGGIGGIAVGFAAKDMLANFLAVCIYSIGLLRLGTGFDRPIAVSWGLLRYWSTRNVNRTLISVPCMFPTPPSPAAYRRTLAMTNRRIYETTGVRYEDAVEWRKLSAMFKPC